MKLRKTLYLLLLSILLAGCAAIAEMSGPTIKSDTWYPVAGYVDGDTFKVKTGNEDIVVIRLLYIDTPETKKQNTPVEVFGPEASAFTEELLRQSGEVRLTFDKQLQDVYGRTLAVVELQDGRILNELLLEQGLAKVLIVEPNVKKENMYKQLEQQAKQQKIGIWSSGKETSHTDMPVRKATHIGIEIDVDKRGELVTIMNTSFEAIDLDGWKLVSVRGNQTYTFEPYELLPHSKLYVASGDYSGLDKDENVLVWVLDNVWNNYESDPAELYNENNELVALWEDD